MKSLLKGVVVKKKAPAAKRRTEETIDKRKL